MKLLHLDFHRLTITVKAEKKRKKKKKKKNETFKEMIAVEWVNENITEFFNSLLNPFMHNIVKWPKIR